eukprot:scaffold17.g499.t1
MAPKSDKRHHDPEHGGLSTGEKSAITRAVKEGRELHFTDEHPEKKKAAEVRSLVINPTPPPTPPPPPETTSTQAYEKEVRERSEPASPKSPKSPKGRKK